MLNRQMSRIVWGNRALRPVDKLVLLALVQLCPFDSDRAITPLRYLAHLTCLGIPAVHRSVRTLEAGGYITRYQHHRRAPTEYVVHPHLATR